MRFASGSRRSCRGRMARSLRENQVHPASPTALFLSSRELRSALRAGQRHTQLRCFLRIRRPMIPNAARQTSSTGLTIWFTGLSAAGKTTLNDAVRERLEASGYAVESLDGDVLRQNLWKDLGFSKQDRDENVRRIGFVADLLSSNDIIVLVSAISPYRAVR